MTNPLVRTPTRELRRHGVLVGAGALALILAISLLIKVGGGRPVPTDEAAEPSDTTTTSSTNTSPSASTTTPTTVTRTIIRECPSECTITFTAAGGADVQMTISHVGSLTDSHPLGTDGTSSKVQVTGTGSFQASATALDWVDLSADPVQ